MPRKMSEKNNEEYIRLGEFLKYFASKYWNIDIELDHHPYNVMRKIGDEFGKSQALKGLKTAVNDILESSKDYSLEKIIEIDMDLKENNIISLSELKLRYSKTLSLIIKRNEIRDDIEYYLVSGIINDTTNELSYDQIEIINRIMTVYEDKIEKI